MTTECTTDDRTRNWIDARLNDRLSDVSRWNALFVGALTVVVSLELSEALPVGQTAQALALLPITLVVMYALLAIAARLERRNG